MSAAKYNALRDIVGPKLSSMIDYKSALMIGVDPQGITAAELYSGSLRQRGKDVMSIPFPEARRFRIKEIQGRQLIFLEGNKAEGRAKLLASIAKRYDDRITGAYLVSLPDTEEDFREQDIIDLRLRY
ncbi:MAG: hypothetical protein HY364_01125 [Candidatus Aenigmarchaeota archaeon]|nr:hypothetical protein [Candidatus Aenigmarchaeota archaeon]